MKLTRRQFIAQTGLASAGGFLGPSLLHNPLLQAALAETIGNRYFVVVFLDGGNDGLNTVTPITNGASGNLRTVYESARKTGAGGLQLRANELAATAIGSDNNTGTPLALHPGLVGLKRLYDMGKVAVIQGCGYPNYSLSHEASRKNWQTGLELSGGGWMGRYLAANYTGSDIPAVNVYPTVAGEFIQSTTNILSIQRLAQFGFPYDNFNTADSPAKRSGFLSLCSEASRSAQPTLKYAGGSGNATLLSSETYPPVSQLYSRDRADFNKQYTENGFGGDIREVAKVIYGVKQGVPGVKARYFEVRMGGYDTHSNQGTTGSGAQHNRLHQEVGSALEVFYNDVADMGVADKLCIVVWSEFSRRIQQNDSGTDHGSQGPMLVIGGTVKGGVYGNHPNIKDTALNHDGNTVYSQGVGDPFRSTDFRDVFGTLLKHWLNMPDANILSKVFTLDSGNPNSNWMSPNFDLGFI